ncbi:MAG: YicC/YloC family endoribonuclease [Sediminimonas sp.]|uniref:YicC/YloC family endoribonuclease n=1 Tax=Sediminimonas sp. TaxID=2823379 RepID=UPI002870808D|nr:YicC/YloC family endoribonuclease [Sediminimonas sp.]MDR9485492.1 YicC/YloC family endoribonuclease [Sediminimonas sp.]
MIQSMTGFAAAKSSGAGASWSWELRSVNAKGLDLRIRVPDWIEGLEAQLRARVSRSLSRGSVTLNLRLTREDAGGEMALNQPALGAVLDAMTEIEAQAMQRGLSLAPATAADVLSQRGVLEARSADADTGALLKVLLSDFETLLEAFRKMRADEGRALHAILVDQLEQVASLVEQASAAAQARSAEQRQTMTTALARVMDNVDTADEARVAQELALIAVKSDITEELDRLRAHVTAARDLLDADGPVGRKLDFLCQEFNREANTLCAKAQSTALTRIGLDLKTVIDQMREQVQNVE